MNLRRLELCIQINTPISRLTCFQYYCGRQCSLHGARASTSTSTAARSSFEQCGQCKRNASEVDMMQTALCLCVLRCGMGLPKVVNENCTDKFTGVANCTKFTDVYAARRNTGAGSTSIRSVAGIARIVSRLGSHLRILVNLIMLWFT